MKISKNSWHYKLVFYFNNLDLYTKYALLDEEYSNLCRYSWAVVEAVFICTTTILGVLAILFSMISSWILAFQGYFFWEKSFFQTSWGHISAIGSLLTIVVVGIFIARFVAIPLLEKNFDKQLQKQLQNKKTFMSWLKTKKRKVCPLIKFTEH